MKNWGQQLGWTLFSAFGWAMMQHSIPATHQGSAFVACMMIAIGGYYSGRAKIDQ